MATAGPNYPAVGEAVSSGDANEVTWVTPENIQDADSDEASIVAATFDTPDPSFYLVGRGYGFAIPGGSTIDGITVEIERRCLSGLLGRDVEVQLRNIGGAAIGANKAITGTDWPVDATAPGVIQSYGGTTDTWTTGLSAADLLTLVNHADFGVRLQAQATTVNADIFVSFIRVTVTYTAGAAVIRRLAAMGVG